MITENELRQLIFDNPRVDGKKLEEFVDSFEKLRSTRVTKPKRRLASPLARRRVIVGEPDHSDPRAVDLRGRR